MKKAEFVDMLAGYSGMSKQDVLNVIKALEKLVFDKLRDGQRVNLPGIGYFHTVYREKRLGHNPRTRKPIEISARHAPLFRFSKSLKEHIM